MRNRKGCIKKEFGHITILMFIISAIISACGGSGTTNDDNDGSETGQFATPVTVTGLPGLAGGYGNYSVFQPVLADISGDGNLDILAGTLNDSSGNHELLYFLNDNSGETLSFTDSTASMDIKDSSGVTITPPLSYEDGNETYALFVAAGHKYDVDDIDIMISSCRDGSNTVLEIFKNKGDGGFESELVSYNALDSSIALANMNDDSFSDRIYGQTDTTQGNVTYILNNGSGSYTSGSEDIISLTSTITNTPVPSFVDIDGDNDSDMFLVEYSTGSMTFYENTGTVSVPVFTARSETYGLEPDSGETWYYAFGDLDGDGDYDAIIGTDTGEIRYAENTEIK